MKCNGFFLSCADKRFGCSDTNVADASDGNHLLVSEVNPQEAKLHAMYERPSPPEWEKFILFLLLAPLSRKCAPKSLENTL